MDRRTSLKQLAVAGAVAAGVLVPAADAPADWTKVRPQVKRWINRHRRYLHHHLPRRKRKR